MLDVYYAICDALEIRREPNFGEPRKGDIRDSNASIEKARKFLGYRPSYDFKAGIELAIQWYKEKFEKNS